MSELLWNLFVVVLAFGYHRVIIAQSHTNFMVKHFDKCVKNSPVIYYGNITRENGKDYLDFNMTSPIPLDKNIGFVCEIETMVGGAFIPLFAIRENDFCKASNRYAGELWYDIERGAQLIPGKCPIPAGRYQVHHLFLEPRKIALQTFPFGTLRLTISGIDKAHSQVVFCVKIEVENLKL